MSDSKQVAEQENEHRINVEVCYALPEKQTLLRVTVDAEATIKQIIEASGVLEQHPSISLADNKVGVFSRLSKLGDTVHDGDRIEIYRPLLIDPKEVRKERALKAKQDAEKAGKNISKKSTSEKSTLEKNKKET